MSSHNSFHHTSASTSSATPSRRHLSNTSTASSNYTNSSAALQLSRTTTLSSDNESSISRPQYQHKRGLSEACSMAPSPPKDRFASALSAFETTPDSTYKNTRRALRPLPEAPAASPPKSSPSPEPPRSASHYRGYSLHVPSTYAAEPELPLQPSLARPHTISVSRNDSLGRTSGALVRGHSDIAGQLSSPLAPDLQDLQKSSTGHLRTLSKLAEAASPDAFVIKTPDQEVTGLHGRRKLQRSDGARSGRNAVAMMGAGGFGWGGGTWMDKQRQFLQAYEYLCHIGEAKEWIEGILNNEIPPIVQLEEALRDGVTLAEVVEALNPDRRFRIFRHPKLQYRHSDNIAIFFRYLDEIELPDLFRFELIDLYEKKNIPKVIYCIHALSLALFQKGILDFRIGNLVGKLQFEHHELEEMQKGLDKAGVNMPSFGNMGANFGVETPPEPEPVESEEERVNRELQENEDTILDLQSQMRGAIVRLHLTDTMQHLWDEEETIVDLQSRIRGDFTRQITEYRLNMRKFAINLQSAARGFVVRRRELDREAFWESREGDVLMLQSLLRAKKARDELRQLKTHLRAESREVTELQTAVRGYLARKDMYAQSKEVKRTSAPVTKLQAAVRGFMVRKRVSEQQKEIRLTSAPVVNLQAAIRGLIVRKFTSEQRKEVRLASAPVKNLQAAIRGLIVRKQASDQQKEVKLTSAPVVKLQAAMRGLIVRRRVSEDHSKLSRAEAVIEKLQAAVRAMLTRNRISCQVESLENLASTWTTFQAVARGGLTRTDIRQTKQELQSQSRAITDLQSRVRANNVRETVSIAVSALEKEGPLICDLQANIRGMMERLRLAVDYEWLEASSAEIQSLQSFARGSLVRRENWELLEQLASQEPSIVHFQRRARLWNRDDSIAAFQSRARAALVRAKFKEKKRYYKRNMEKVVNIQRFVRARFESDAYKSITKDPHPKVNHVKMFAHILNDSDLDFNEEIKFEDLRKQVIQQVRQNELAEQYISQLDIKIALLVKNKITIDEVAKYHKKGPATGFLTNPRMSTQFDLKALNKNSRQKLDKYQELFFTLQTQPQYLARLFRRIREVGTAEKDCKKIETLMMVLFGYAQKSREEYYLLKLVARSVKEEVDYAPSLQDYERGNFFWTKLLSNYTKSPRDRKFLRDFLGPFIREQIVENEERDLESDPLQIYKSLINEEELRTGCRSERPEVLDTDPALAIRDPDVRQIFIDNLGDLREVADLFIAHFGEYLHRIPYGVRFIASQLLESLTLRFHTVRPEKLHRMVSAWLWKFYFSPAFTAPDKVGITEKPLAPRQQRNLAQLGRVVYQAVVGRDFAEDCPNLAPLNAYLQKPVQTMSVMFKKIISVPDAEKTFGIDEFNDLYATGKPTLYIKLPDIFAIHNLVLNEVATVCPSRDDALRIIFHDLGSVKNNETEMLGVSSSNEIQLTLIPKLHDIEDPDAEIKALFMETKRSVLYVIRVQSGKDLMEIFTTRPDHTHQEQWAKIVKEEFSDHSRGAYPDTQHTVDIAAMSFREVKATALQGILDLEAAGLVTQDNNYQDILDAIAIDVRTKGFRRLQRGEEMMGVRLTLKHLLEKKDYLESQHKAFDDYIESAMMTLQKKGKKRFLLPFTKQYNHERELQRSGRVPKFGSFKYSARALSDKGVLASWEGYAERQYEKINLTISCDEVGVFFIEGTMGSIQIPGASAQVTMDDLLQAQFNNHQFMDLFEGTLRLNVNLFLHLLYRKFYRSE